MHTLVISYFSTFTYLLTRSLIPLPVPLLNELVHFVLNTHAFTRQDKLLRILVKTD